MAFKHKFLLNNILSPTGKVSIHLGNSETAEVYFSTSTELNLNRSNDFIFFSLYLVKSN